MKELLMATAEYNRKATETLITLLESVPADTREKDAGLYFRSMDGVLEHLAWAGLLWLKRFASFGDYPVLKASPLVALDLEEARSAIKGNAKETIALLRNTNSLMAEFIAALPEAELPRRVTYRTTDGQEMQRILWHTLMQALNHGTHHRGELSAVLDQHKIKNDLNNFISYV